MAAQTQTATVEELEKITEFRATKEYQDALETFTDSVVARRSVNDDRLILRFIRGCSGKKVKKAVKMFVDMLEWREAYGTDGAFSWKFEQIEAIKKSYPHGFHKYDKQGRPIYIERVGHMDQKALLDVISVEDMMKFHVQTMEYARTTLFAKASERAGGVIDQQLTIVDLDGLGLSHLGRVTYSFLNGVADIDQNYYPEVLGKMYIINAPWTFKAAWAVIRPWLNEGTRAKIEIVRSGWKEMLLEEIDEDVLPDFLGGKDTTWGQCDTEIEVIQCAMNGQRTEKANAELIEFKLDPVTYSMRGQHEDDKLNAAAA